MAFIDVHAHLDFFDEKKIDEAVKRARKAGLGIIVNSGISAARIKRTLELAAI